MEGCQTERAHNDKGGLTHIERICTFTVPNVTGVHDGSSCWNQMLLMVNSPVRDVGPDRQEAPETRRFRQTIIEGRLACDKTVQVVIGEKCYRQCKESFQALKKSVRATPAKPGSTRRQEAVQTVVGTKVLRTADSWCDEQ